MKRTLLSMIFTCMMTVMALQLQGQDAPDFMLTDIDGNEHHMYSYLDDGKPVIIDFFTTWCGPCWSLHQTHVLEDVYSLYGPDGADIMMAMAIECDPSTTLADLQGTGPNTAGNWLDGSTYPYIDLEDTAVPMSYGVNAYPTIMMVTPDREYSNMYGVVPSTTDSWTQQVLNNLDPKPGVDLFALESSFASPACGSSMATIKFINFGDTDPGTANVQVLVDGQEVDNADYPMSVSSLSVSDVEIPINNLPTGEDVEVELVITPEGSEATSVTGSIAAALNTDLFVRVVIEGDGTADLDGTNWEILRSDGSVYYGADVAKDESLDLKVYVDEVDCYSFRIYDPLFGDGLSGGSVYVETSNGEVLMDESNFGAEASADYFAASVSSVDEKDIVASEMYPNPASNQITVEVSEDMTLPASFTMVNQLGQLVVKDVLQASSNTIQLNLENGSYIATVTGQNGKVSVQNIMIQK